MDEKTLTALKESIAHWERVVANSEPVGATECALCKMFTNRAGVMNCTGCPVYEYTHVKYCDASPYPDYVNFVDGDDLPFETEEAYEARRRELAQAELDFLRSLLPVEQDDNACPPAGTCDHCDDCSNG